MKHLFTLTILIALAQFGFSQSACDNWNSIQGKTESELTDIKRLKIYWSKRCACESGQITGGDWDYTVRLVNENYDMYHERRNKFPSEYSYNGALVPDRKISVNDCNSDNSLHINDSGTTNCGKKAFDANKDPQNYGNDFMRARCQCLEGVPFEEDAKKLEATMKINFQNAQTYYGNTLGMPQPLAWTECPILQLGQGANTQNSSPALVYTGRESDLDKLKDQYLETFSTRQSFSAYVSGENIKRIGVTMAKDFADNLKELGTLIESTDPLAMHQDYMQKVSAIESVEAKFNEESNTYFFESGQQLGGSIMNNDYETAIFQAGGILNAHLERKEAEEELEKQKKAMKSELQKKLYKVYKKTKDFNEINRRKYLKFAAFADDDVIEAYYLGLVENLDCFDKNLWSGVYNVDGSKMVNNCLVPEHKDSKGIENKFITEDVRYSQLADKKYKKFLETGYNQFRDAAISFASAACDIKPTSKYFLQIATYYRDYSAVMELSNYLAAEKINADLLSEKEDKTIESLRSLVIKEVKNALETNDVRYIESFINLGLDQALLIDGKDLYTFAIYIDQPLGLQTIVNKSIEGMTKKDQDSFIQQTIIQCAIYNSASCIQKFSELGVEVDFKIQNKAPIEVAESVLAEDAFFTLLQISNTKDSYLVKYKDSPIHILRSAENEPELATEKLERLIGSDDFARVIDRMVEQLNNKKSYFTVLGNSRVALNYLQNNQFLTKKIKLKFCEQLFVPFYESTAHLYFNKNLLYFNDLPTLSDLDINEYINYKRFNEVRSLKKEYVMNDNGDTLKSIPYIELEYDEFIFTPSDNLAWVAYTTYNPELFGVLDEKYNLADTKADNGENLFKVMLSNPSFTGLHRFKFIEEYYFFEYTLPLGLDHLIEVEKTKDERIGAYFSDRNKFGVLGDSDYKMYKELRIENLKLLYHYFPKRQLFYSSDFNFDQKIDGIYPMFYYLNNILNYSLREELKNSYMMIELYEILIKYNFNRSQLDENGGTLLHWFAQNGTKSQYKRISTISVFNAFPSAEFINSLEIDKTIKNNEGKKALDIWKELDWLGTIFPSDGCFNLNLNANGNGGYYKPAFPAGKDWWKAILK